VKYHGENPMKNECTLNKGQKYETGPIRDRERERVKEGEYG
jgi:hypothetical protein